MAEMPSIMKLLWPLPPIFRRAADAGHEREELREVVAGAARQVLELRCLDDARAFAAGGLNDGRFRLHGHRFGLPADLQRQ